MSIATEAGARFVGYRRASTPSRTRRACGAIALGGAVLVAGCETGGVDERERIAVPQLRMEPGGDLLLEASERIASRDVDVPLLQADSLRRQVFLALGDGEGSCRQFGTVAATPTEDRVPTPPAESGAVSTEAAVPLPQFELMVGDGDLDRLMTGLEVGGDGTFVVLWSATTDPADDSAPALALDTSEIGFTRVADEGDRVVLMLTPDDGSDSVPSERTCTGADGSTVAMFDPNADGDLIDTLDELNAGIAFAGAAPEGGAMIPIASNPPAALQPLATITTVPPSPLALDRTLPPSWSLSAGGMTRARLALTPGDAGTDAGTDAEAEAGTLALNVAASDSGTSLIVEAVFGAAVRPLAGETIDMTVMHGDMPGGLMAGVCADMPDGASPEAVLPYTFMEPPPPASNVSAEGYYRVDTDSDVARCQIGDVDADANGVVSLQIAITVTAAANTTPPEENGTGGAGPNSGNSDALNEPRRWSWIGDVVIHRPQPEQPTSR